MAGYGPSICYQVRKEKAIMYFFVDVLFCVLFAIMGATSLWNGDSKMAAATITLALLQMRIVALTIDTQMKRSEA